MTNPRMGYVEKSNSESTKYVERITIATFTKLLDISIVANNRSGFSCSVQARLCPFSARSLSCAGDKEKKAISEAETSAEHMSSKPSKMMEIISIVPNVPVIICSTGGK